MAIQVISGDEESRLAYLAALAGLGEPEGAVVVFDTGGGSSQFTFGRGTQVDERFSVDVGAARYTEQFGLDSGGVRRRSRRGPARPSQRTWVASTGGRRRRPWWGWAER